MTALSAKATSFRGWKMALAPLSCSFFLHLYRDNQALSLYSTLCLRRALNVPRWNHWYYLILVDTSFDHSNRKLSDSFVKSFEFEHPIVQSSCHLAIEFSNRRVTRVSTRHCRVVSLLDISGCFDENYQVHSWESSQTMQILRRWSNRIDWQYHPKTIWYPGKYHIQPRRHHWWNNDLVFDAIEIRKRINRLDWSTK